MILYCIWFALSALDRFGVDGQLSVMLAQLIKLSRSTVENSSCLFSIGINSLRIQ